MTAVSSPRDLKPDVGRLRAETPGCAGVAHFNHAGSSLMPQPVIDTVIGHIEQEAHIGGYEAEDDAAARLAVVYRSIARLLNAAPDEIAVVENATRAWDMAFYAIPLAAGDRILTSVAEYASNALAFFQVAARGVRVEVVPNDEQGQLSVAALAGMLDERVKVIAVSHMPTNGGLVQPAAAIGRLARQAGAIYVLDACQTAGQAVAARAARQTRRASGSCPPGRRRRHRLAWSAPTPRASAARFSVRPRESASSCSPHLGARRRGRRRSAGGR